MYDYNNINKSEDSQSGNKTNQEEMKDLNI